MFFSLMIFNHLFISGSYQFLSFFYNLLTIFMLFILVFLTFFMFSNFFSLFFYNLSKGWYSFVEIMVMFLSSIFVVWMVINSSMYMYLINFMDFTSFFLLKVIGHQWYWHYEMFNMEFDSFYIYIEDLNYLSLFRNQEVSDRLVLPVNLNMRLFFTSQDVIHSWFIPALSFKMDCTPGVITVSNLIIYVIGSYYGQCAEICGVGHSFMPILLEVVNNNMFIYYLVLLM